MGPLLTVAETSFHTQSRCPEELPLDMLNVYVHIWSKVRVLTSQPFGVHVYAEAGQPHNLAHCQVRWSGHSTQVALPLLEVIVGDKLPRRARKLLEDHLDEIVAAWNRLNPGRAV